MRGPNFILLGAIVGILSAGAQAEAQESGDPAHGLAVARQICAPCHAVRKGETTSPDRRAPPFDAIAAVPGMSPVALNSALHTSHRDMPNIMLAPDDLADVVAYVLSLKTR